MCLFERWFCDVLLPRLKKLPGNKLIIGDNLASHISMAVIDLCRANNIRFVCLPPNSTDKLQPLDVGVFGPLKKAWKSILTAYKLKNPKVVGIQKTDFPSLLASLILKADPGKHLPAAFDKCGLFPVNSARGMERIPSRRMVTDSETTRALLDSTLGEKLEELRGVGNVEKRKRGKKIKVPPGKSFCADPDTSSESEDMDRDEAEDDGDEEEEDELDPDELLGGGDGVAKSKKRIRPLVMTSDEEDDGHEEEDDSNEEEESVPVVRKEPEFRVGTYVAAVYDSQWYIAQVEAEEPENECEGFTLLRYMQRKGPNQFVWGEKVDTLKTINEDILSKLPPPHPCVWQALRPFQRGCEGC